MSINTFQKASLRLTFTLEYSSTIPAPFNHNERWSYAMSFSKKGAKRPFHAILRCCFLNLLYESYSRKEKVPLKSDTSTDVVKLWKSTSRSRFLWHCSERVYLTGLWFLHLVRPIFYVVDWATLSHRLWQLNQIRRTLQQFQFRFFWNGPLSKSMW